MTFYRLYLGSAWPLPSVSRFTNMSIVDKRVRLALAHRKVMLVLAEPSTFQPEQDLQAIALGAGIADFQILHRSRKTAAWNFLSDPQCPLRICILGMISSVLERMTYEWFGAGREEADTHDVLKRDGVVCKGMATFLELIGTWHMEDRRQRCGPPPVIPRLSIGQWTTMI